jgi:hypothetical protein
MLVLLVHLHAFVVSFVAHQHHRLRQHRERGQTTAEYALVLLGAAAVALLVVAWATKTNRIGRLLDSILDTILDRVK